MLLLHGWPGDRTDYREVVPLLTGVDVITPDLRGFGESDKHQAELGREYTAVAQARSLIGLIGELALNQPVLAAGSRYLPRCCGRNTIRCSPGNGPTGSVTSSPWPG